MLFERFISRERGRGARHRRRFRARTPRGSAAVPLRQVRPRAGRHDGRGHHLSRRARRSATSARRSACRSTASTRSPSVSIIITTRNELGRAVRARRARPADSPLGGSSSRSSARSCGFPRHLSQHVGGMVITQGPLCELVPIENAAMAGPHRHRVGQGRPRRARHPQGRLPRARHADGDSQVLRPDRSSITAGS